MQVGWGPNLERSKFIERLIEHMQACLAITAMCTSTEGDYNGNAGAR